MQEGYQVEGPSGMTMAAEIISVTETMVVCLARSRDDIVKE